MQSNKLINDITISTFTTALNAMSEQQSKDIKNLGGLVESVQSAYEKRDYRLAINHSQSLLEHLPNDMNLHFICATSYAKMGNYKNALWYANKLTSTIKGCLLAGDINSMFGYHERAIQFYERGILLMQNYNSSDFDNSHDRLQKELLEQCYELSHEYQKKRIDLIDMAPYDIMVHILTFIGAKNIVKAGLLYVSKRWYEKILDCPDIWSTIFIDTSWDLGEKYTFPFLHQVDQHISNVEFNDLSKPLCENGLVKINQRGRFHRLEKLNVYGTHYLCLGYINAAVMNVSRTLKELDISLGISRSEEGTLSVLKVLSSCPKLKRLSYRHNRALHVILPLDFGGLTTTINLHFVSSQLTTLILTGFEIIQASLLKQVLKRCPHLRHLELARCHINAGTPLITTYCRELETLALNYPDGQHQVRFDSTTGAPFNDINDDIVDKENKKMTASYSYHHGRHGRRRRRRWSQEDGDEYYEGGLYSLAISVTRSSMQDCFQLIQSNRNTLEDLRIGFDWYPSEWNATLTTTMGTLKRLRSLHILCKGSNYNEMILAIILNAPCLVTLNFDDECGMTDTFFAALKQQQLQHLEKLSIRCCRGTRRNINENMNHDNNNNDNDNNNNNEGDATIVPTETTEAIDNHGVLVDERDQQAFDLFRAISRQKQPLLQDLSLTYCDFINDTILLDTVASIGTLRRIAFTGLSNVTEHGLVQFFKKLKNRSKINTIELVDINAVTDHVIEEMDTISTLEHTVLSGLKNISCSYIF